jgi:hypothetical protein
MTIQDYLIIENNIVNNSVLWDGDVNTWEPPIDSIQVIQETTPAMIWKLNDLLPPSYVLTEIIGAGDIGFTWDGTVLTTNEPQPIIPVPAVDQPTFSGTTTI